MNAETFYCQEISSITGNLLDEFTLKKPAGWLPDTAARASFASSFVSTYVPTSIELNGFQGMPYGEQDVLRPTDRRCCVPGPHGIRSVRTSPQGCTGGSCQGQGQV